MSESAYAVCSANSQAASGAARIFIEAPCVRCESCPGRSDNVRVGVVERERIVAVVEVGKQRGEIDLPASGRHEMQLAAQRRLVTAVRVIALQVDVVLEAVTGKVLPGQAPRRAGVADCATGGEPCRPRRVAGDQSPRHAASRCGVASRVRSLIRPASALAPIARALWTAQHFDLLDIERRGGHADAAQVDVVDQEADGGVRRALVLLQFAYAAHLEIARARRATRPVQVRDQAEHVLEVLQARGLQQAGRHERNARGNLRQRLLAQRRGHHDLFEHRGDEPAYSRRAAADRARGDSAASMQPGHAGKPRGTSPESGKKLRRVSHLPAPYAGTNRIRFNGFVGGRNQLRGRHLRPSRPPQGCAQYSRCPRRLPQRTVDGSRPLSD